MKNHVWRPLIVVFAIVAVILAFRAWYVPEDFGSHDRGFTFGFHRLSNEQEWKDFPSKYQSADYCANCHEERAEESANGKHATIGCQSCHGPALEHPDNPEKMPIDRSRDLCIRCHSELVMPSSARNDIPGIDPAEHNVDMECADCHNSHAPNLMEMEM